MISKRLKATVVSLGVAALLFPASVMAAGQTQAAPAADRAREAHQKLTRADFDRCNQQAMQIAGIRDADAPAAMPGTPAATTGTQATPGAERPATRAGQPAAGVGTQPGVGAQVGEAQELDQIIQAYRSCLQQAKN